ncbi:hypothetical protein FACS189483_02830 [Spirochaetia bacterium]|nr:hypothetical protein FACS189483_02830 [Spirochaetia bacterium]
MPNWGQSLAKAGQFRAELWSVRARTCTPRAAAKDTNIRGDRSREPQGERQEWLWKSARRAMTPALTFIQQIVEFARHGELVFPGPDHRDPLVPG